MQHGRRAGAARLSTGVTLPYVTQGDPAGTPVLLLHAWGESLGVFDRLLPLLPGSVRAMAMDQRGHGDADKPAQGYLLSDFAADVRAFMDAVGLASAVLVGSSSGGYVAQQVAVTSPERTAGLVVVGSPRSLQGRPAFADEVDRLTDPVEPEWVKASLEWFPTFHEIPGWYMSDRVEDGVRIPARVWRDALAGLVTAAPPTEAGTITTPTLIIWGGNDELLPWEQQQALAAAIRGSRIAVYPDAGHLVLWEQPEQVAADLVAFVDSLCG